jgi:tetratricopeptide (TPR) repeat protein
VKKFLAAFALAVIALNHSPAEVREPSDAPAATPRVSAPQQGSEAIEREYRKLLEEDDAAHEEIDRWIRDAWAFEAEGGASPAGLNQRIEQRRDRVRKGYLDFLQRNPDHARARLAYGSFLNELGDEREAAQEWEKARELDPANPAAWNNLANFYGHRGPVKKAFTYYEKAIELDPAEPVYYWNFATTVYLFRKDVREHYGLAEQQVFDKSLELYRKALALDPENFILASDYAQSYYGTNPPRWEEGRVAWEKVMKIARDDIERQGVHIHLARINLRLQRFAEARRHLEAVNEKMYQEVKERIGRNLEKAMAEEGGEDSGIRGNIR